MPAPGREEPLQGSPWQGVGHRVTLLSMSIAVSGCAARCLHPGVLAWVEEITALCRPAAVHWCDGSAAESAALCEAMVANGTFTRLDPARRPGSYLARSTADDVARAEGQTYICSRSAEDAGPTNHWAAPAAMQAELRGLFAGSMRGRTLYVVPYCMGPVESSYARIAVQITDAPYAVVNMAIMTRLGAAVLDRLGRDGAWVPCLHGLGAPLDPGHADSAWPCDATHKHICHFPDERAIWSYGSGYGGNALLGKKCFALRIASVIARDEGWLAEHMLILGLKAPDGRKRYIAAAFPSACGKTNLAMLRSSLPGWEVTCVGDDIAWMHIGPDGRLRAINPEAGFFGVAPGTSAQSNPNALAAIARNTIFTNVALTPEGDVWWEGLSSPPPPSLTDWTGKPWTPASGRKAAHPNSRYTTPAGQCPTIDPAWQDPAGVPIDAILIGGRRAGTVPLVTEALSWAHGVFLGSTCASETTAAAEGATGQLRRDPFAMLPFCGYHMGDYFAHWLRMGEKLGAKAPRIYAVNWFRKGADGRFLWPGFGDNIRVLKWIVERLDDRAGHVRTPIGVLPTAAALDTAGLDLAPGALKELLTVDREGWRREAESIREGYATYGGRLPTRLAQELADLRGRLAAQGQSSAG
jgi:phosphoenolpyruvate carboxykinase (GTP)